MKSQMTQFKHLMLSQDTFPPWGQSWILCHKCQTLLVGCIGAHDFMPMHKSQLKLEPSLQLRVKWKILSSFYCETCKFLFLQVHSGGSLPFFFPALLEGYYHPLGGAGRFGLAFISLWDLPCGIWCSILMVGWNSAIVYSLGWFLVFFLSLKLSILLCFSICNCFLPGSAYHWVHVWSFRHSEHQWTNQTSNRLPACQVYQRNQR